MYQVVIVDDEPFVVERIKTAIDWSGYNFEICCAVTDPIIALQYIEKHSVQLLITDVSMPEMTGIELTKRAKAINPLMAVIVLSAFDKFEFVRSALRNGVENYLLKPLDEYELTESIRQIVSHMKEREELSNSYGLSMLTFRSSFTEQWVKNSLNGDEFKNRANLLGVNLDAGNYTVLIFNSIHNDSHNMSKFFDLLLSSLIGHFLVHFYFETPYRLICILSLVDKNICLESYMQEIVTQISTQLNFEVLTIYGTTVANYQDVTISYEKAKNLNYLRYTPLRHISYQNLDNLHKNFNNFQSKFEQVSNENITQVAISLFSPHDSINLCLAKTLLICSFLLDKLPKEVSDIFDDYPDLRDLLYKFPSEKSPASGYIHYVEEFTNLYYQISNNLKQSIYPCVDAVIKAVQEFNDKDISLKTMAIKLNMSPSYLGNIFRQQTGLYFNDYLTEARLKYAAHLIEHTDMKMKDIVDIIGYSSQTYFNRSFKRFFNVSPTSFRRKKALDQF